MLQLELTGKLIRIFIVIFSTWLLMVSSSADARISGARQLMADKVIVLVIDDLGIEDIRDNRLKNIKQITGSGAVGLMNTRTKSLGIQNRQAAYLTIGMGTRVSAPRYQSEKETLIKSLKRQYPGHIPGKIGQVANETGKKIALLGSSDYDNKPGLTWLAAMDNFGDIDSIDAGSQLLTVNPGNVWGRATDSKRLLYSCIRALQTNDIIFVDFGDTTRVAEARDRLGLKSCVFDEIRFEALKSADLFIGELIKKIDKKVVLLIISPTSPVDNDFTGIKNLTPVFLYKKDSTGGILTSDTTRREGLISNIDIAPAIFAFLGINISKMQLTGEKLTVLPDSDPLRTITENYTKYADLKKFRYIVHGVYVLLMFLVFYFIFLPIVRKGRKSNKRLGRAISVMIIAIPILSGVTAVMLQDLTAAVMSFLVLLLLTGYLLSATFGTAVLGTAFMSLATSVLLIFDLLTGMGYVVNTPLGFNDVFTGGRYYGINNDSMGILLGATVFGTFTVLERFVSSRLKQTIIISGILFLAVLSQTPGYGANVGGTIAAIATGTLACLILLSKQRSAMKNLILAVTVALTAELVLSFIDIFSVSQTHAGKTAARLLSDNFTVYFLEIVSSKLSVFITMLMLPPWNILFFMQLYFYRKISINHVVEIKNIETNNPLTLKSFQIILFGAGSAFIFNDTGIIAAAMMLIYVSVPFGMLLVREGCNLSEYRQAVPQRI